MKYLLSIIVALVIVSTMVQSQTSYQIEFPYNRTVQVVRDTLSSLYTTARSYNWINIPKATNITVLASAVGTDASDADTITVTYLLRNSKTGSLKASATLGTFEIATSPDDQEKLIGTVPDSTFVGYDQIRFGLTLTKLNEAAGDNFTFRLFINATARSGGKFGLNGVAPEFNDLQEVYYESNYTSSTASDTTQWITFTGAERITFFARATDSLAATINYRLRNKTIGKGAASGSSDPITTTFTNLPAAALNITGASVTYNDTTYRLCTLNPSVLAGYEQIQFEIDYTANCTTEADGTTAIFRLYAYFFRRD